MKTTLPFWLIATLFFVQISLGQTTYNGAGLPALIPPTGTGGFPCVGGPTTSDATSTLTGTIGGNYNIVSLTLDLTHDWDADLEMYLIAPSGTMLDLSSDNGGMGDNYTNTVFQDGAPNITTGTAPFTGTFEPEGGTFAETFAGEDVNGIWQLSICDDSGAFSGNLLAYSITFDAVPLELNTQPITVQLDENGMATIAPEALLSNAILDVTNTGVFLDAIAIDVPLIIFDEANGGGTTNPTASNISVAEVGQIGLTHRIDNVLINLTHTSTDNLDIKLIAPSGTEIILTMANGGTGDNYTNTVFTDGGADITAATAPFTGNFEAQGGTFTTVFENEFTYGDWTLEIADTMDTDEGELLNFEIHFEEIAITASLPDGDGGFTEDIVVTPNVVNCDDLGTLTASITATGAGGAQVTDTAVVTVVDPIAPTADEPEDITAESTNDDTDCSTVVNYELFEVMDNCDVADVTFTLVEGLGVDGTFPIGTTTETYTIADASGNEMTYSFDVIVTDGTDPIVDCPDDFALNPGSGGVYTLEDFTSTTATDNCSESSAITISQNPAPGTQLSDGTTTTITITATDEAGNEGICSFEVTVDTDLGLNDQELNAAIQLYPNPTQGPITLSNSSLQTVNKMRLYDSNGRLIQEFMLEKTSQQDFDITALAAGLYLAEISNARSKIVRRLIKL